MQPHRSQPKLHTRRSPASHCVICGKSIEEIGGRRIISQRDKGLYISSQPTKGGSHAVHKSVKVDPLPLYVTIWGEKAFWNDETINRAIQIVKQGECPWFCQICGTRACYLCGQPINYPVASEILYDSGGSSHCPIIPHDPGCINPACKRYKDWGNWHSNTK